MARLPPQRDGDSIKIKGRSIEYSLWPVARRNRRYGIQSRVFATNPWAIIRASINERCPANSKVQAHAFRDQAEDYFNAAHSASLLAAKPVLIYYCFLNLAKTYALVSNIRQKYAAAYHGLKDRITQNGIFFKDSYLEAVPNTNTNINIFDDFFIAITGSSIPPNTNYKIQQLLPQILQGHRLWVNASDKPERFLEVANIDLKQNKTNKQIWINLEFYKDDIDRLNCSRIRLLNETKLIQDFREVISRDVDGRTIIVFEQRDVITYRDRPSDNMHTLVKTIQPYIWTNALSVPPYRKYYIYKAPLNEHNSILPQLLSIYAIFYFFGSITRYRPEEFADLAREKYGAMIEEIITTLPNQFMYLLASYFAKQEVVRAAIL